MTLHRAIIASLNTFAQNGYSDRTRGWFCNDPMPPPVFHPSSNEGAEAFNLLLSQNFDAYLLNLEELWQEHNFSYSLGGVSLTANREVELLNSSVSINVSDFIVSLSDEDTVQKLDFSDVFVLNYRLWYIYRNVFDWMNQTNYFADSMTEAFSPCQFYKCVYRNPGTLEEDMLEYIIDRTAITYVIEDLIASLNDRFNDSGIICRHKILGLEVQSAIQTTSSSVAGCVVGEEDELQIESGGDPVSLWYGDSDFATAFFTCPQELSPDRPALISKPPIFDDDGQSLNTESLGYNHESCKMERGGLSQALSLKFDLVCEDTQTMIDTPSGTVPFRVKIGIGFSVKRNCDPPDVPQDYGANQPLKTCTELDNSGGGLNCSELGFDYWESCYAYLCDLANVSIEECCFFTHPDFYDCLGWLCEIMPDFELCDLEGEGIQGTCEDQSIYPSLQDVCNQSINAGADIECLSIDCNDASGQPIFSCSPVGEPDDYDAAVLEQKCDDLFGPNNYDETCVELKCTPSGQLYCQARESPKTQLHSQCPGYPNFRNQCVDLLCNDTGSLVCEFNNMNYTYENYVRQACGVNNMDCHKAQCDSGNFTCADDVNGTVFNKEVACDSFLDQGMNLTCLKPYCDVSTPSCEVMQDRKIHDGCGGFNRKCSELRCEAGYTVCQQYSEDTNCLSKQGCQYACGSEGQCDAALNGGQQCGTTTNCSMKLCNSGDNPGCNVIQSTCDEGQYCCNNVCCDRPCCGNQCCEASQVCCWDAVCFS